MKRTISIIICILIIFNLFIPSASASGDAKDVEKILTLIKPRIPDTTLFSEFDSGIRTENGVTMYSFNWGGDDYRNMYVTALQSGVIIEYGFYEEIRNELPPKGFDRISTDEAVRKTQVLVNKLNPSIAGKLFVEAYDTPESFSSDKLYFKIVHKEGGVPVQNDTGRVTVDVNAEKITSFRITYTEGLKYVSPHNILSEENAKQAFSKELGLTLSYMVHKDFEKRSIKAFPVYTDENGNTYLDANTGKATEIQLYYDLYFSKNEAMSDTMVGGSGGGLSAAESKELENISGILSASDAEKLLRTHKLLNITGSYAAEETSLRKVVYQENKYIRSMVFRAKVGNSTGFIHAEIDAATGEVLSFSNLTGAESDKKLGLQELKTAADNVFAELAPEKFNEYVADNTNSAENGYFTYTRHVNGIPVSGDTVSIELNTADATLLSYRINYTDTSFPAIDNVIDHNTACQRFFEQTSYTPLYIPQKSDESLKKTDTTTLVFTTEGTGIIIDAKSGQRITASGAVYSKPASFEDYTDIEGHYAEEKIKALHRFGIGFDGAIFNPDQPISQAEFIKLAEQALLGTLSVLDLRSPAANTLTRIEAARLICKALKIDKYAEIEGIYNCPFEDVETGKGYASLLWGLGIINGTAKNKFSPNNGLTRAQAAIIIYNTMDKTL
ncbi:MAG: S-layer homology domain-containing protein [Clostridia bacterium]|nr:S-layer homology domain-containing protein [Clostridia bacterium]